MHKEEDPRITQLLKEATLGLEDDPELRLEVKAELRSHLDEHIQESLSTGNDETTALNEAIAALGDTSEMATRFIDANRRRMKLRSWSSALLRKALVPLSVITALWVTLHEAQRHYYIQGLIAPTDFHSSFAKKLGFSNPQEQFEKRLSKTLSTEDRQFVFNNQGNTNPVSGAKELWQSSPDNLGLFANYVASSLAHDEVLPPEFHHTVSRLDSDNGYFLLLEGAVQLKDTFDKNPRSKTKPKSPADWIVKDQARLDQGIAKIQQALRLKRFEAHRLPLLQKRLAKIPFPNDLIDTFARFLISARTILPEIQLYKQTGDAISLKAYQFGKAGDREGLRKLTETWLQGMPLIAQGNDFLVESLVSLAISRSSGKELLQACQDLEMAHEIATLKPIMKRLNELDQAFKNRNSSEKNGLTHEETGKLGLWSGIFFIPNNIPDANAPRPNIEKEFKASRELDYILIERIWIAILIGVFLAGLGYCAIASLWWKKRHQDSPPVFLLLRLKDYALILGGGVMLPLIIFFLLSRYTPLGGHQWSADVIPHLWVYQLAFLGGLILSLLIQLTRSTVRRRLRDLGNTTLPLLTPKSIFTIPALAGAGMLLAGFAPPFRDPSNWMITSIWIILLVLIGWLIVRLSHGISGGRTPSPYSGTLTRSMIPILGGSIVILGFLIIPFLQGLEEHWVRQDTMLDFNHGLGRKELEFSQWMKNGIAESFSAIDPSK